MSTHHAKKQPSIKRMLVTGSLGSFGIRVLQAFLGLAISIVLARSLGAEAMGQYAATIAIVSLLAMPSTAGLNRLAVREISRARSRLNTARMRRAYRFCISVSAGISTLAVMGGLLYRQIGSSETVEGTSVGAWMLLLVPVIAIAAIHEGTLRGLKHVIIGQSFEPMRNLAFLTLIGSAYCLTGELTLDLALLLYIAACATSACLSVINARRRLRRQQSLIDEGAAPIDPATSPDPLEDGKESRRWSKDMVLFILSGGIMSAGLNIDLALLGLHDMAQQAGLLQVAAAIAGLALFGLRAINMTVGPFFVQFRDRDDIGRMQKLASKAAQFGLAYALPCAIVFWLAGDWVINLLYGTGYAGAAAVLSLLAIAQVIQATTGTSGMILGISGRQGLNLALLCAAMAVKLVVSLLFIPSLGAIGAGYSAIAYMATLNLLQFIMVWKTNRVIALPFVPGWLVTHLEKAK